MSPKRLHVFTRQLKENDTMTLLHSKITKMIFLVWFPAAFERFNQSKWVECLLFAGVQVKPCETSVKLGVKGAVVLLLQSKLWLISGSFSLSRNHGNRGLLSRILTTQRVWSFLPFVQM